MVKIITRETVNSRKAIIATKKEFARAIKGFRHAGNGVYVNNNGTKVYEVYNQDIYHVAYVDHRISKNNCGYMQVGVGSTIVPVHRLVARAWCKGWSEEKNEVDHINNVRDDNFWKNLRWVTHSENMLNTPNRTYDTVGKNIKGRYIPETGNLCLENGVKIKMTPEEYIAWRKERGYEYKRIARKLGVTI